MPSPKKRNLTAVAVCMRNEGQFLLEWVAHQLAVGFDRVFVASNDCTDGTDLMLDRLEQLGAVIHVHNHQEPETPPQISGINRILAHPKMKEVAWLLRCDADEFLDVTAGKGQIKDLIDAISPKTDPADVIALCWRPMGSCGLTNWPGGNVIEAFTRGAKAPKTTFSHHKSIFRPERFSWVHDHMPKDPLIADPVVKNTAGVRLNPQSMHVRHESRYRGNDDVLLTWENASMRHYAVKSEDIFLMKNVRGDGMNIESNKYFLGSTFWQRGNRNRTSDQGMLRYMPAIQKRLDGFRKDPILRQLDIAANEWFRDQRSQHLTAERRLAWTITRAAEEEA